MGESSTKLARSYFSDLLTWFVEREFASLERDRQGSYPYYRVDQIDQPPVIKDKIRTNFSSFNAFQVLIGLIPFKGNPLLACSRCRTSWTLTITTSTRHLECRFKRSCSSMHMGSQHVTTYFKVHTRSLSHTSVKSHTN